MIRKKWDKPKLIVLFKGRPEEAVIAVCKGEGLSGSFSSNCLSSDWPQDVCEETRIS